MWNFNFLWLGRSSNGGLYGGEGKKIVNEIESTLFVKLNTSKNTFLPFCLIYYAIW